jgi:hypothetical protein
MKVAQEILTVIADSPLRELSLIVAGLRITFNEDEARLLSRELSNGIGRLNGGRADHFPSPSSSHSSASEVAPIVSEDTKEKVASGLRSILGKAG